MAKQLSPEMMELVAERFHALAEPKRLQIMQALRGGERTVGDLVEATGLGTANVSKHLQLLNGAGFAVEQLNHRHAGDMLLQKCVDSRDPHAHFPERRARAPTKPGR